MRLALSGSSCGCISSARAAAFPKARVPLASHVESRPRHARPAERSDLRSPKAGERSEDHVKEGRRRGRRTRDRVKGAAKKYRRPEPVTEAQAAPTPPTDASKETKTRERDPRLPPPGTVIRKLDRQGNARCECVVEDEGIRYNGRLYRSLSAAALVATKDLGTPMRSVNGFAWWGIVKPARLGALPRQRRGAREGGRHRREPRDGAHHDQEARADDREPARETRMMAGRRNHYREANPEGTEAHPIDAELERRLRHRGLRKDIIAAQGRVMAALGKQRHLYLKLEELIGNRHIDREEAMFNLGFEHGLVRGRADALAATLRRQGRRGRALTARRRSSRRTPGSGSPACSPCSLRSRGALRSDRRSRLVTPRSRMTR